MTFLEETYQIYEAFNDELKAGLKVKEIYDDDKSTTGFFAFMYTFKDWLHLVIHGDLSKNKEQIEYEKMIRILCNYVRDTLLPIVMKKINHYSKDIDSAQTRTILNKWIDLESDLYALAAYRNLDMFALYIERGNPKKIWRDTMHLFKGFFDYSQQMVFGSNIRMIRASFFPGAGKTYAMNLLCAFWYGYCEYAQILRITYSEDLCKTFIKQIGDIINSKEYRKVFPVFDLGDEVGNSKLYSTFSVAVGFQFTFSRFQNFYASTRDGQSTGKRAGILMIDDLIKDSTEANSDDIHEQNVKKYDSTWASRADNSDQKLILAGTMWSSKDLLNVLYIRERKYSKIMIDKKYPWTELAIREDTNELSGVFIATPILDEKTNTPTCPNRYSLRYIKEKQEEMDTPLFQAVYQQNPIPPEEYLFSINRLNTYNWENIPEEIRKNQNCDTYAFIDPTRRGIDFFAMGIFRRYKSDKGISKWYLIDAIFEQKPSKDEIPKIFLKVRQHQISRIGFENNVDVSFGDLLKMTMSNLAVGVNDFIMPRIEPQFSYGQSKETKIRNAASGMVSQIIYPDLNLFSTSSELGKAMLQLTSWRLQLRAGEHDDFPDMISMFVKYYCEKKALNTMQVLDRSIISF